MDTILRNARIDDGTDRLPVDIGIEGGRIAAIEPGLPAGGEEIDAGGRLVTAGFVETHIHLDKSCILDRCRSERGDLEEAIGEVARVKKAFTPEGRVAIGHVTKLSAADPARFTAAAERLAGAGVALTVLLPPTCS